jgi:uncharacterized protein YndB with AHSA1/START domain
MATPDEQRPVEQQHPVDPHHVEHHHAEHDHVEHHHVEHQRVEQHVTLDAAIDDVWDALTDPDQLAAWLGGEVQLDVRPAGTGRVVDEDGTVRDVLVTTVDHHRRIAWHWWDDHNELSSVELTIEAIGDAVRLRVVEVLMPSAGGSERVVACTRRWTRATGELWARLSLTGVARTRR